MEDNKQQNNCDEIEIDLVELWHELLNCKKLIASVTVACTLGAAAYSFIIAKPVYQTTALINVPTTLNANQLNSFAAIAKSGAPGEGIVISNAAALKNTYVLQITAEGSNPEQLKTLSTEYTKKILKQINDTAVEQRRQQYSKDIINLIRADITYISSRLHESAFTEADGSSRLQYLIEKIERNEANYIFPEATIAKLPDAPSAPVRPRKDKNVIMACVAGLLLSCGYVVGRYLLKK